MFASRPMGSRSRDIGRPRVPIEWLAGLGDLLEGLACRRCTRARLVDDEGWASVLFSMYEVPLTAFWLADQSKRYLFILWPPTPTRVQ
jgi:hypothetical protein